MIVISSYVFKTVREPWLPQQIRFKLKTLKIVNLLYLLEQLKLFGMFLFHGSHHGARHIILTGLVTKLCHLLLADQY